MSKSQKGKKASYNLAIKQCKKIIDEKFNKCPFDLKERLFLGLEEWAIKELGESQQKIFLTALYNTETTQETQMLISINKALNKK